MPVLNVILREYGRERYPLCDMVRFFIGVLVVSLSARLFKCA